MNARPTTSATSFFSMPTVRAVGQSLGYSQMVVGMIWIFSTAGEILPYQSGVLVIGFLLVPLCWPLIGRL